ncbi:MAG: MCE family protein [Bacteroidetes bacterium]|nr:MAG: MCE family protein [Bacteroidota bacterium]
MENYTPAFKARLGLFIAVGLAIFVIAIFYIGKQQHLFNPVFKVTTHFYNVSGLQVGNNVRFSGINVGVVDNIRIITDSTVQVDMLIRRNVQEFIKADSEAAIGSSGIIGDRIVIIAQGSTRAAIVADGQHINSIEPVETDAIIASLQVTASSAEVITRELAEIMENINSGRGMLGRLIVDSAIAENVNQTIANFMKSSEGLDETIEVTKENVFEFMEKLQLTVARTEIASNALGEIMVKINSGEGTLGMLIQDTVVAHNLSQTMINVTETSKGLDEFMDAVNSSFFFRRYFRKLEEEKKRMEKEAPKPKSDIIEQD